MGKFFDALFKAKTLEETTAFIAAHWPVGRAWDKKHDPTSNIHAIIQSEAAGLKAYFDKIEEVATELNVNTSNSLLAKHEQSVGLPDACLGELTDRQQRIDAVLMRLTKQPLVTLEQLQTQIVDKFFPNVDIKLYSGSDYYSFEYDFEMSFLGDINEKFILVIEVPDTDQSFEYEFEMEFDSNFDISKLECLLRKVIPANVAIIIEYISPVIQPDYLQGGDGQILQGGDGQSLEGGSI